MLFFSLSALILLFLDHQFAGFATVRNVAGAVAAPFYWLVDLPVRAGEWGSEQLVTRSALLEENARLRERVLLLEGKSQSLAVLRAENARLRALLKSSALLEDTVLVAEMLGVSPNPNRHEIIINKGSTEGVYVGQAVIDAKGLMGQVVDVSLYQSRVLLISDATHAVPVQVNRNGVRAIAEGVGLLHQLELRHVPTTTDLEIGDLLVSSGLGGRFPVGYPVATVTEIINDPGEPFARVKAQPMAELNRSRHVLLIFRGQAEEG